MLPAGRGVWFPQEDNGGGQAGEGCLMKGNSQQVTPSFHLGVLSQRLDLPLPGWPRGALAHKSSGRPSGSRSATQKGACRASPSVCVETPPAPQAVSPAGTRLRPHCWIGRKAWPCPEPQRQVGGWSGPERPHPTSTHQRPEGRRREGCLTARTAPLATPKLWGSLPSFSPK